MTDVLQQDVLQKAAAMVSNTSTTSKLRSVRASLTEWDRWGKAAESHSMNMNAFIRVVMNEASSYALETKPDARESRNQLLDVVRGRGPVSKYFDRR